MIYDELIRQDVDYQAYGQWLDQRFKAHHIEKGNLLEVGCGTGTMTVLMEKMGYHLTGIDSSEEMLMEADRKAYEAGSSIRWILGDIATAPLSGGYDGVFSTMDTFNYILDEDQLLSSFKQIYAGLNPGGLLVFDVNTDHRLKHVYGNHTFHYVCDDVCYIWECSYEDETQISRFDITFFVLEDEDTYTRFDEVHCQRAYTSETWFSCLEKAGFVQIQNLDFLSDYPSLHTSEKIHWIALKPV